MTPKELYELAVKNHVENVECVTTLDNFEHEVTFYQTLARAGYDKKSKCVMLEFGYGWCVPFPGSEVDLQECAASEWLFQNDA